MKKTKFSFYFIFISVFTAITILVLIIQNSYLNLVKPASQIDKSSFTPINLNLDLSIISDIQKREDYSTQNIPILFISSSTDVPTKISTISATVTPTSHP
jgi:hypothetical protein